VSRPPNMRVQRTRSSASPPRLPLTRRPLAGRRKWLGLAAVAAGLMLVSADAIATRSAAEAFAGCYQLSFGPWRPALDLGADAKYIELPTSIRLLAVRGRKGWESGGFLLRSIPGKDPGRGGPSFWVPRGANQLELRWTDGFTGVNVSLSREGSVFRGLARTHWDFARATQERTVLAKRVPCFAAG
jgi:hypothetical protein